MSIEDPLWPRADEWLAAGGAEPELAVVGVPSSVASLSPSRAYLTPARARVLLARFSTFDGEHEVDLNRLAAADLGDWDVAQLDAESSQAAIAVSAAALPSRPVYAFVGGDNAITRPLVRGLAHGDLTGAGVLTLDAHHDVRSLERGPTNGTPMRGLLEDGLPDGRVAQVGIHTFSNSAAYRRYCDEHGFAVFTMQNVDDWGIEETVAVALEHLAERCDWIYVDIDIDVLDRAFAPACPGSRPGGMTPRQLITAAWVCGLHPKVRAADLVEVDAAADVDDVTVMALCATLLSFAAGLAHRRQRRTA